MKGYRKLLVDGAKAQKVIDLLKEITDGPQEGVAVVALVFYELNKMRKDGEEIPSIDILADELRATLHSIKLQVVH